MDPTRWDNGMCGMLPRLSIELPVRAGTVRFVSSLLNFRLVFAPAANIEGTHHLPRDRMVFVRGQPAVHSSGLGCLAGSPFCAARMCAPMHIRAWVWIHHRARVLMRLQHDRKFRYASVPICNLCGDAKALHEFKVSCHTGSRHSHHRHWHGVFTRSESRWMGTCAQVLGR